MMTLQRLALAGAALAVGVALMFSDRGLSDAAPETQAAPPLTTENGMSTTTLAELDPVMQREISLHNIPGGTIVILHHGVTVFSKAYGDRALHPKRELATMDTLYDLASMSKAIGTATAVVKLMEQGKIRLWDRVAFYDPAFAANGKARVTVEELLEHSAGLPSALDVNQSVLPEAKGEAIIDAMPLHFAPGSRYEYCNTCFIELAKIVRIVSHQKLADYTTQHLFAPLGVGNDLLFDPPQSELARTTPEAPGPGGRYRRGRFMIEHHGFIGAEGHAGLFGTADAVARFGQMLLNGGEWNGTRILAPATVEAMIRPRYLGRHTQRVGDVRGLGWDEATSDSSNRGELFSYGGFGHTGSTGCSFWVDPATQTVVVLLTNSAHITTADDDEVVRLYGKVTTIAAAAVLDRTAATSMQRQATDWSQQVAAQARGFDAWAARDQALWLKTGSGSRY